jgi:D-3-phosphoglycerate dehydrogenase
MDRPAEQIRVLLLENIHPDATARLVKDGYQVETRAGALDTGELIAALDGVHVLGIRSGTHVTERVLASAPDLLAVGAFCIGGGGSRSSTPRSPTRAVWWSWHWPRSSR